MTIEIASSHAPEQAALEAIDRAFGWFHEIEERCTRFHPSSELMQLCQRVGEPVPVSTILYEAVCFALHLAEESDGAFDPTVGRRLERMGFNREFRTGTNLPDRLELETRASYRDVAIDPDAKTILLRTPLTLDLGSVAKGLAVDMAARELVPFRDFAIDAGGDLYLGGSNRSGAHWCVGIRHPRRDGETIASLNVSDQAVCTSGDYERITADGHPHIVDPRDGDGQPSIASATVVASGAMLADGLATAAFVLGPERGMEMLNRLSVEGLLVTTDLRQHATKGLCRAA